MRQQSRAEMGLREGRVVTRWQEVTGPMSRGICPGHRLASAGSAPGSRRRASISSRGTCPIRTHIRRPNWPPLLYFPAVLPVRSVRISLLTCGAKRARTADLLHAIQRQPVHQNTYVQVTVPESARWSGCVRACCGTFLLYRSARRQIRSRRAPPRAAGRFPVSDIGDELDRLARYCRDSLVITVIAEHCEPFRAPR
jgi:hypothetical protein